MNVEISKELKIRLVLDLTENEAEALKSVMGAVGGDSFGPSSVTREIYRMLEIAGIKNPKADGNFDLPDTWEEFNSKNKS